MPEKVTYSLSENLIHVKSIGNLSAKEVRKSILDVAKIKNNINAKNVLVDQLEAISLPSNISAFNLGSDIAHFLNDMNIAIVCSKEVKEDVKFLKKVAKARGGNIKLFYKIGAAQEWIKNQ